MFTAKYFAVKKTGLQIIIFIFVSFLSYFSNSTGYFLGMAQNAEAHEVNSQIPGTINSFGIVGLTSMWSETRPYYCSRFVRQVFQRAFPRIARHLDDNYFGATAYETERMWARQGKLKSYKNFLKVSQLKQGDVVFQDYPVYGHVGIVVVKNNKIYIAENTVRYGMSVRDHRALTTLARFGRIRSVGRYTGF